MELFELHECVKVEIGSLLKKENINSVFDNFVFHQFFSVLSKYYMNKSFFNELSNPHYKNGTYSLYKIWKIQRSGKQEILLISPPIFSVK